MSKPPSDPFLTSCAASEPLRFRLTSEGKVIDHAPLTGPFAIVGRDERRRPRLDGDRLSPRHAYIQVLAGRALCVDLGSKTGVLWDGQARPWGWLDPGRAVQVGPVTLALAAPPADARPPADDGWDPLEERADPSLCLPKVSVAVSAGDNPGPRLRLNRLLTLVGRDERCRLRLRDDDVSDFHCALVATPLGAWVVDLLSQRGTLLNGRPVERAPVRDGGAVQVGPFLLQFTYSAAQAIAPTTPLAPVSGPAATAIVPGGWLAERVAGGPTEGRGLDPSLLPVLHQFNTMQQQMFEQFQQTVLMMLQMFTSMHQIQTALVREELAQLHAVTRELEVLQKRQADAPPVSATAGATSPGKMGEPRTVPERKAAFPHASRSGEGGRPPTDRENRQAASPSPSPAPATPAAASVPAPPGAAPTEDNIHAWLNERVAALEQERQGRWQKVLSMILGG